jgi:outer membrane protein OmpA-like peptidoglycan-associated protein
MNKPLIAGLAGSVLLLSACTTTNPDGTTSDNRAATGALIGAVAGAVIGNQASNRTSGRAAGAAIGAIAGAAIGGSLDEQEQEFNEQLAEERANKEVEVERVRDDLLKLTLSSEVSFDTDSAAIKPSFRASLDKLGDVLLKHNKTRITVVGHTDSRGTEAYNQALSERRAQSVVNYFRDYGVAGGRLTAEGRGELAPRADNDTAGGRQLNRRVEVFLTPTE